MIRKITIKFMDGMSITLNQEWHVTEKASVTRGEKILNQNMIAIRIDDVLRIYPVANIRSIEIDPTPEHFPVGFVPVTSILASES